MNQSCDRISSHGLAGRCLTEMAQRNHTIVEIAAALGVSRSSAFDRAAKEAWPFEEQAVRGGKKRFYIYATLPKGIREALDKQLHDQTFAEIKPAAPVIAPPSPAVEPAQLPDICHAGGLTRKAKAHKDLTDIDRARQEGALILCRAIDEAILQADCSAKRAITELSTRIIDGSAHPELIAAATVTYAKPRKTGQTVNSLVSRLQKMYAAFMAGKKEGDVARYLVPGQREKEGFDPLDIRAFLIHYCRPSRPPVTEAWRAAEGWYQEQGLHYPAKDTFYRIEKSLPVTLKYRGRMTGGQWRSLLPYVNRDVSMFHANDIWVGDGHSFKAKVQHPIHGQAFTPEVTLLIDWVSRKIVGWSIDLAESTIAVSAAFRHAQVQTRARPLVYYSDNGGGQTGQLIDCEIHGTLARQGIAHETGIPGNAQGRGIIERIWQVTLIPLARTYPTCTWKGADKETVRKSLVAINKKDGVRLLPSFGQFVTDIDTCINKYNSSHPHRELNGMTPDQAYQAKLDPDSIYFGPSDTDINTLWMPEVSRTPQRGVVSLFGNEYFNAELVDTLEENEKIRVRFDIHDATQVWLLRMDGRFICTAEWDGNKRAAFPVPFVEQKRADRAAGKIKRGERIIDEANAELGNTLEGDFIHEVPTMEIPSSNVVQISEPPSRQEKPNFAAMGDYSHLAWLADHPEDWTPEYRRFIAMRIKQGNSRVIEEALEEFGLWGEIENFVPQGDSDHQRAEARDESYKVAAVSAN